MSHGSPTEAAGTAIAGAVLAGAAGSLVGLAAPAAVIGGLNGAISGWREVYDWRAATGLTAFALDSTWALATTSSALAAHALGALRGAPGYARELSRRRNRHVYSRGFQPRRGFAITLGNVVAGAGDVSQQRRVRLVTDHEDVHVWQARWFGPAYPVLYAGWMAGGAVAGAAIWLTGRRDESFGKVVESCAYYLNPFEWWAYSRHGQWPPRGKIAHLGWRRPVVRSFAGVR